MKLSIPLNFCKNVYSNEHMYTWFVTFLRFSKHFLLFNTFKARILENVNKKCVLGEFQDSNANVFMLIYKYIFPDGTVE